MEFGVMCAWKFGWSQCEPLHYFTIVDSLRGGKNWPWTWIEMHCPLNYVPFLIFVFHISSLMSTVWWMRNIEMMISLSSLFVQFTLHVLSSALIWWEQHASLIDWLGIDPPYAGEYVQWWEIALTQIRHGQIILWPNHRLQRICARRTQILLEMIKMRREVNFDNTWVGWYQSMYLGSYSTPASSRTNLVTRLIVLLHDPMQTAHWNFSHWLSRYSD